MKRKRLIAAFLSLMLVVTVVMPAANALGTGTIELAPNEGTSATETPVEEPAEPETPVEEPTDPGASDEQTPTDTDDTDTSDEGTEQTPTDPDDTGTSDEGIEQTPTDPDDTDTSDEETPDTPAEEPTEPETPVEEPTEPETPTEEPTNPETPEQLPTEPETPVEEVPELPANELLPAEPVPLAEGDNPLTIYFVDTEGNQIQDGTTTLPNTENYIKDHDSSDWENVPEYDFGASYTLQGVYANRQNGTAVTGIRYVEEYTTGWWPFQETHPATWQYRYNRGWGGGSGSDTLNALYLVYDDGSVTLSFNANKGQGTVPEDIPELYEGDTVTLPEAPNLYRDGFTFIGWTTEAADYPFDKNSDLVAYAPGTEYEVPDHDFTLYAVWSQVSTSTTAYFYIRLDGNAPQEPGDFPSAGYTIGIKKDNVITQTEDWIIDNSIGDGYGDGIYAQNEVYKALLSQNLPTQREIELALKYQGIDFDSENQYILWYVQKTAGGSQYYTDIEHNQTDSTSSSLIEWHIDGVLMDKNKLNVSYDRNLPAGVTSSNVRVPMAFQVESNTTIKVGQGQDGNMDYSRPTLTGYTFVGWNTSADGNGVMYQPGADYTVQEDTIFYAIWRKGTGTALVLTKKDGLGEDLAGATFTISADNGGMNKTLTGEASHTVDSIETGTIYTITETAAPEGYQLLENSTFHFKVESNNDMMDAYLCDEQGTKVDNVQGVELSYDSGSETVYIDVTNIGYFYIFHTANIESGPYVEEIPIDEEHVSDGTFDIVRHTEEGYLYGGYYRDYALKGDYQIDNPAESEGVSGATSYTGDQTSWDSRDAYTDEIGTAMTPEAGKTYFLKEVPNTYLHPATYVVYDTHNENKIVNLYLLTATDDANYSSVGFEVTGTAVNSGSSPVASEGLYNEVVVKKNGQIYNDPLTASDMFGVNGLLALSDTTWDNIAENANYVEIPYFVTLDGVKVTGNQDLKVYLRDCTYVPDWKRPGITKIALSSEITAD